MLDRSASGLDGKVAVVTGGGGGIGRAISEALAAHGASVVVAEIDSNRAEETVAAIEDRGGSALACGVDVRERTGVDELVDATRSSFEHVDVLVNNVGDFLGLSKPFVESTDEDWEALYAVNLKHVMLCCRAFLPGMIERGRGGSVINVSTIEAFRGIPNCSVYAAFNAGITGFTKSLALELGPKGIRVNAIAPETTETLQVPTSRWIPDELKSNIPYWIPLGRFGKPDDAAGCAVFLASELSAWVTGTTIHLDGGALAAGGFYRVPGGDWTNLPVVKGAGIGG
ncbi:glucose 1-dehydrogenase [Myxococcota bacterium]|nr:glucose 1-dehydrogenase [Myxococcota bacterium]